MASPRKGFLHIGLPKTGTTTLQNNLFKNRETLLAECGILYPSIDANHTTPLCTMFLDDPTRHVTNKMLGLSAPEDIASRVNSYYQAFENEILHTNWTTLLLSAEGVSNLNAIEVAKLRGWAYHYANEWTVIAWVRHPVDMTRSVAQQLIKGGYTLEQLNDQPMLPNFQGKLSIWLKAFGAENVRVVRYEDALAEKSGIIGAFCRSVGIAQNVIDRIEASAGWDNQSLSYEAAHLLSSLNRQRALFDERGIAQRRTGNELHILEKIPGRKFDLPPQVKQKIKIQSRKDVEWLNQTFGLDSYRDIFVDDPTGERGDEGGWKQATIDKIALTLSDLMNASHYNAEMIKGNQALQQGAYDLAITHYITASRVCPDAEAARKQIEVAQERGRRDRSAS